MSRDALPAAAPMSTGCSVARRPTPFFQLVHDVLQVLHRAGEPVDARHDQGVAGLPEVEQDLQLGSAVAPRAARLLGAEHLAPRCFEGGTLDAEVLIEGADAGITIEGHGTEALRLTGV
jgi:hypothetical protein